jgi:hypothetical protein
MDFSIKKGGKVTVSGRIVVAADGKSRTVTASGTNARAKGSKTQQSTTNSKQAGRPLNKSAFGNLTSDF